jgi:hypothetical protein
MALCRNQLGYDRHGRKPSGSFLKENTRKMPEITI